MTRHLGPVAALLVMLTAGAALAHDVPPSLLLGDGKISSAPRKGYVFACQSRFNGGGAFRTGPWVRDGKWYPREKATVDGSVTWPDSRISVDLEGEERVVRANNLPSHPTGRFPVARSDDAYRYDRNPNAIRAQDILLRLPALPEAAVQASCVPMGMIGFALTGAAIFNAFDAMGRDAPAYELQDSCNGHPERRGQYHYHNYSPCMPERGDAHSPLLGYMLDGFGIYGPHGEDGEVLTSADLDACHGHSHEVEWDGKVRRLYHYHFTDDYPYTIGCYRGTPLRLHLAGGPGGDTPGSAAGDPRGRLERAAKELGVSLEELRRAVGPPPPDFEGAAAKLGISAERLRRALGAPP